MKQRKIQLTIKDRKTKHGWEVRTIDDLILALLAYPVFATVASSFLQNAVIDATRSRSVYENVEDFANYLLANYI